MPTAQFSCCLNTVFVTLMLSCLIHTLLSQNSQLCTFNQPPIYKTLSFQDFKHYYVLKQLEKLAEKSCRHRKSILININAINKERGQPDLGLYNITPKRETQRRKKI